MHFGRQTARTVSRDGDLSQKPVATRVRTTYDGGVMVPEPQGEG